MLVAQRLAGERVEATHDLPTDSKSTTRTAKP
jgi:hypothetical protein